jgi:hypothetical protein
VRIADGGRHAKYCSKIPLVRLLQNAMDRPKVKRCLTPVPC